MIPRPRIATVTLNSTSWEFCVWRSLMQIMVADLLPSCFACAAFAYRWSHFLWCRCGIVMLPVLADGAPMSRNVAQDGWYFTKATLMQCKLCRIHPNQHYGFANQTPLKCVLIYSEMAICLWDLLMSCGDGNFLPLRKPNFSIKRDSRNISIVWTSSKYRNDSFAVPRSI